MFSPLEQFDVFCVYTCYFFNIFDLSFFNILVPFVIIIFFFIFCYYMFLLNLYLIPTHYQYLFELSYIFIFNLIKQQVGILGYPFFPLIYVLFVFILISNLFSLIPFGIALTSHIILILWLSLSICFSIFILGLCRLGLKYLKIFIPTSPLILLPILILIEIFSYIIRAFSLAIRLSANVMAGHTLIYIVSSFVINITKIKLIFFILGVNFILAISILEFGVAFLQAYVFCVLVCIYLSDALHEAHH